MFHLVPSHILNALEAGLNFTLTPTDYLIQAAFQETIKKTLMKLKPLSGFAGFQKILSKLYGTQVSVFARHSTRHIHVNNNSIKFSGVGKERREKGLSPR